MSIDTYAYNTYYKYNTVPTYIIQNVGKYS